MSSKPKLHTVWLYLLKATHTILTSIHKIACRIYGLTESSQMNEYLFTKS